MELRGLESRTPPWLKNWKGDGILTRTASQTMADAIAEVGVPTVELRATRLEHKFPFVGGDNHEVGQMVAQHLLDRGFRRFGVYGLGTEDYFELRRDKFIDTIRQAGLPCSVYHPPGKRESPAEWERQQEELRQWVTGLAKPVGLFACNDQLGFWLLDACRRAKVAVPEEVAVVGAENDESLCTMASPPLSSIHFNAPRIGYEAAALLHRMMSRGRKTEREILIKPLYIVTRQSSDVLAIEDEHLAHAVRFIRANAGRGINVADVLKEVPISRTALEQRMKQVLGRTPKAEILRVQLNHVKELLAATDLSLEAIAERSGFAHPQYMAELFHKKCGQTPGSYRSSCRAKAKRES